MSWQATEARCSIPTRRGERVKRAILLALAIGAPAMANAQPHPSVFLTRRDVVAIRAAGNKYPLFTRSLNEAREVVATALTHPIDVPQPGEAGGYAHERHKQNYREMQLAG